MANRVEQGSANENRITTPFVRSIDKLRAEVALNTGSRGVMYAGLFLDNLKKAEEELSQSDEKTKERLRDEIEKARKLLPNQ